MDEDLEPQPGLDQDRRAELGLGALVCVVVAVLVAMLLFVLKEAWPSFAHNGFSWFEPGGNVDTQIQSICPSGELDKAPQFLIRSWPLIWSTILTAAGAAAV